MHKSIFIAGVLLSATILTATTSVSAVVYQQRL
jgi:hypothetical protein